MFQTKQQGPVDKSGVKLQLEYTDSHRINTVTIAVKSISFVNSKPFSSVRYQLDHEEHVI